jgi:hypothetical protein
VMAREELVKAAMEDIALKMNDAVEGKGYALFFPTKNGRSNYVSNADRPTVVEALEEWLDKTSGRLPDRDTPPEPPDVQDARLAHQRRCAEIGQILSRIAPIVLFLFDFNDQHLMAYFTNIPDARGGIEQFIRQERGRS